MKKAANFILKLLFGFIIISVLIAGLYVFTKIFKIWNLPVFSLEAGVQEVNKVFFTQLAAGLTVGVILLIIFVFIFPIFTKKINTKEYFKNIVLGVVASAVFYISQSIYHYFEKFGKFYLVISIAATGLVTLIIIEIMSLSFKTEEKEIEFRTAILGCIVSGLVFGIVLHVAIMAIDIMK